jgi:uncharacterized lipoprotein YmbA
MNKAIIIVGVALALSGCISISVPNSPNPRFYTLPAIENGQVSKNRKANISLNAFISIGPVKIPQDQDRPQIVTVNRDKTLNFAQFDRWGEPLDLGITRLITDGLTAALPQGEFASYSWNSALAAKYQVAIEITQLDSELNGDLVFAAQWIITDTQTMKPGMMKKFQFRQAITPQDYFGLAKTLSVACASLSEEIAQELVLTIKK